MNNPVFLKQFQYLVDKIQITEGLFHWFKSLLLKCRNVLSESKSNKLFEFITSDFRYKIIWDCGTCIYIYGGLCFLVVMRVVFLSVMMQFVMWCNLSLLNKCAPAICFCGSHAKNLQHGEASICPHMYIITAIQKFLVVNVIPSNNNDKCQTLNTQFQFQKSCEYIYVTL